MTPSSPHPLAPVLADAGLDPAQVAALPSAAAEPAEHLLAEVPAGAGTATGELETIRAAASGRVAPTGALVVAAPGDVPDRALARWRDALWPDFHATALSRVSGGGATHRTLGGSRRGDAAGAPDSTLLFLHRREWVQSPEATVEKFDKNAVGWNGEPGSPGYAHFRWMRRFVGRFARPRSGDRVLDFGCGAGWCGIESVAGVDDVTLCAFDPSPEMVRIAEANARAEGVARFEGRTGFGSAPPFPREGEAPFDLVISSGVVSFAPDVEAFLEGLVSTVRHGGTLVLGDINADSRGMRARRRDKPLLPVREMNARTADELRARLERRGFHHAETAGYQLTWPVPEAMHLSEQRLKGLLSPPLLLANRAMAALDRLTGDALCSQFDSWVMRFTAPKFMGVTTGTPDSKYVYDAEGNRSLRQPAPR